MTTNRHRDWPTGRHPGHTLATRLQTRAEQVWRFTVDFQVPFTNNPAEQPQRMVKLQMKIGGCRRSVRTGARYCLVRSLPFRRPLGARIGVAHAPRHEHESAEPPLTEHEAKELIARAEQLTEDDQPHRAIDVLRAGAQRAAHDPIMALQLQHALASALFYVDEYTRAAPLYDKVAEQFAQALRRRTDGGRAQVLRGVLPRGDR